MLFKKFQQEGEQRLGTRILFVIRKVYLDHVTTFAVNAPSNKIFPSWLNFVFESLLDCYFIIYF